MARTATTAQVTKRANGDTVVKVGVTGRMAQFLAGEIDVRDLDDEELARGQFRDERGKFGIPSQLVPREVQQEMIRRLLERGDELWRQGYNMAIRCCLEICSDPNNDPRTRLTAAQYIIERTAGKTPDRVLITADDAIETLFRTLLDGGNGLEPMVLDADVVEDDAAVG